MAENQKKSLENLYIPLFLIIWPWFFLALWIPPFFLGLELLFMITIAFTGLPVSSTFFLEDGSLFCYTMLAVSTCLNLGYASYLFRRKEYEKMGAALRMIRNMSALTYPALLWGIPFSIFFLMGPARNKHIFILIMLSIPALNLSGAFYAVPLVLELRKERKISLAAAVILFLCSFIIWADILSSFYIRKNMPYKKDDQESLSAKGAV